MGAYDVEKKREEYRLKNDLPKIENYAISKEHMSESKELYDFISEVDFANGDIFCFKSGGDGDNGEALMDLLDAYFSRKMFKDLLNEYRERGK